MEDPSLEGAQGQMRYLGETPSTVRRHGPEYLGCERGTVPGEVKKLTS